MKRKVLYVLLVLITAGCLFGNEQKKVLFVYEESNEKLDPWLTLFRTQMSGMNLIVDESAASAVGDKNLSSYDSILIYGSVMAFTSKEPVRDWLETEPDLTDKDVLLFVTANRWFLDKYTDQLVALLKGRNAQLVDAVTAATKNLSSDEKKKLVADHLKFQE